MESVTLDKQTMHEKERIMPLYAELVYNGYWFSKKRLTLQKIVDKNKNKVNGTVSLKVYTRVMLLLYQERHLVVLIL